MVGQVVVGEGAVVEAGASVRGPSVVGSESVVERGATVGPYASVGDDCVVAGTTVEESVVCDGASIRCEERIVESVICYGASGEGRSNVERGSRYVLGSDARIVR